MSLSAPKAIFTVADLEARIGQPLGQSRWFTIDQSQINAFADVTEDHQFIHTDSARAAESPFGTTIAHGFLTLSLLSAMLAEASFRISGTVMSVNYGFDKLRFLSPVPSGSQVRAVFTLSQLTWRGDAISTCLDIAVQLKGQDKPVLIAEWIIRHYLGEMQ